LSLALSGRDRSLLAGEEGPARALALRLVAGMAEVWGARGLIDIVSAHVDGCLFHGRSGLDFAERLLDDRARVVVPTTLNVGALDLLHPENVRRDAESTGLARRLMAAYESMGCRPIWTCAPYQAKQRPAFGDQIAWAESNAIVFANSVLGARTNRYGDFIDICAALTGRAPDAGLHRGENRRGRIVYRLDGVSERLLREEVLGAVLGYLVGEDCGSRVPVIVGLPAETEEDTLKALGAAAASSGAVALFHAVGVTPEAPDLETALHGKAPERVVRVGPAELRAARDRLATAEDGPLTVVALGSPHFSPAEFDRLLPLLERFPPHPDVELVVCTHRLVLAGLEAKGAAERLRRMGVRLVVDTCIVVTPILRSTTGALMTNSAKFAHYAPSNVGLESVFGSLEECVRSAHLGRVWRDPDLWEAP